MMLHFARVKLLIIDDFGLMPLRRPVDVVKKQIWIAVPTQVLLAIVRQRHFLAASMQEFLQILSSSLFVGTWLDELVDLR